MYLVSELLNREAQVGYAPLGNGGIAFGHTVT